MRLVLVIIIFMWLGAYMHEGDIQRSCREKGVTGYSAWQGELICKPTPQGE